MSRAIKVEDQVYEDLDQLRGKGETFSQVIEGFLQARTLILEQVPDLQLWLKYREWQEQALRNILKATAPTES